MFPLTQTPPTDIWEPALTDLESLQLNSRPEDYFKCSKTHKLNSIGLMIRVLEAFKERTEI